MDAATESETRNSTVEQVCVPVMFHRFFQSFTKECVNVLLFDRL